MVIVNAKAFDGLSPEVQKAVMDAAAKAETRGWEMSMAETDEKKKVLADNGMNVAAPSDALKSGLAKVGEQMVADCRQKPVMPVPPSSTLIKSKRRTDFSDPGEDARIGTPRRNS
ncbi:Extracellular solute-binding protein, family 7 [Thalassospira sp. KO164]|nr:Extracellular solute-binding protein, family 7 [Thalassospira sp. KO164]